MNKKRQSISNCHSICLFTEYKYHKDIKKHQKFMKTHLEFLFMYITEELFLTFKN